jgi:hypothetical protein
MFFNREFRSKSVGVIAEGNVVANTGFYFPQVAAQDGPTTQSAEALAGRQHPVIHDYKADGGVQVPPPKANQNTGSDLFS